MRNRSFSQALVVAGVTSCLVACSDEGRDEVKSVEELMDPATCKECHEQHYDEWAGSMHAYAAEDPVFRAMNERGQEETGGRLGPFCVNCHAPLAVELGLTEDGLDLDEVPKHLRGVTCYFCHNVDRVEGTHNNPIELFMDQTMRGNFADPVSNTAHRSEYSRLVDSNAEESATLCGPCHDIKVDKELSGASEDVHLERTFQEFQETLFSGSGVQAQSCADCHMQEINNVVVADFDGVQQRTRHSHTMPAVDIAITDFPDRERQRRLVQQELDMAIRAQLCVLDRLGPIRVTLDNFAAGHNFPSGATQDRRVWLEVVAYDAEGNVLFSSGVVDDETPVVEAEAADPDFLLLRDRTYDAEGNEAHMFWDVASYESKTIPGAVTNDATDPDVERPFFGHTFVGSTDLFPDTVTLRILFRPMGLDVLDDLIESGHLEEEFRSEIPTFAIVPNRGIDDPDVTTDVTLRWKTGGDDCVENGANRFFLRE